MTAVYEDVYVCVSASCLWEKYMFHHQTIFCPQWSLFLFPFGGDYRNHFKGKPRLLPLFLPPCLVGAARVQRGPFSGWPALFLPAGLAERLEGQLEMKLLLSAICLTL